MNTMNMGAEELNRPVKRVDSKKIKMKKFIKYASRLVMGLFTLFWGLATYFAYTPDENYHHCEAGQNDGNPIYVALVAVASLLVFCFVWYKTR